METRGRSGPRLVSRTVSAKETRPPTGPEKQPRQDRAGKPWGALHTAYSGVQGQTGGPDRCKREEGRGCSERKRVVLKIRRKARYSLY